MPQVAGLHRRWRTNYLAAASHDGFLVAGGGSQMTTGPDGCPRTIRAMDIVAVDDEFDVRWRWPFPEGVFPMSIAAPPDGGAVATFGTHGPAGLGQLQISEQAVGVMRLDGEGRLAWARVLATGYQRAPHYVAVEPGPAGRIVLGMQDQVELVDQQGGGGERRGIRVHLLAPSGELERELIQPWEGVSGVAWTAPDHVLIIGDRRGNPDPQMRLLPPPDEQRELPPEAPRSVGIALLLDAGVGEPLWQREWGRGSPRWEARPTPSRDGAVGFIDIFSDDPHRRGEPGGLLHRLVVLDETDGTVRFTRVMGDGCGRLHSVAAHPRTGDFVTTGPRRCTGRDHGGTSLLVERLAPDGTVRWSETLGEPHADRERSARLHVSGIAIAASGRAALIGHAGYVNVAGTSFPTDFEHFALVLEP